MPRQDTKLESEGAEFLVLGQLLIEGIPAYKSYSNSPRYDLVATWPETNRSARIQVKSRWATGDTAFPIKNIDCDFVVLVRLNRGYRSIGVAKRDSPPTAPEYYVLAAHEANKLLKDRGRFSYIRLYKKDKATFERDHRRRWDKIQVFLEVSEKRKTLKAK